MVRDCQWEKAKLVLNFSINMLENNRAIACYTKALELRKGKYFWRVTEEE